MLGFKSRDHEQGKDDKKRTMWNKARQTMMTMVPEGLGSSTEIRLMGQDCENVQDLGPRHRYRKGIKKYRADAKIFPRTSTWKAEEFYVESMKLPKYLRNSRM